MDTTKTNRGEEEPSPAELQAQIKRLEAEIARLKRDLQTLERRQSEGLKQDDPRQHGPL